MAPRRRRVRRRGRRNGGASVLDYEVCFNLTIPDNSGLTGGVNYQQLAIDASRPCKPIRASLDCVLTSGSVAAVEIALMGPFLGTDTGSILARSRSIAMGVTTRHVNVVSPASTDFFTPASANPILQVHVGLARTGSSVSQVGSTLMITGTISIAFQRRSDLITLK